MVLGCGKQPAASPAGTEGGAAAPRRDGSGPGAGGPPPPPVDVQVAPIERGQLDDTIAVVGTLRGDEELTLSAEQSGRLAALHFDLGARVGPGELMAEIEPRDYEIAVQASENQLSEALAGLGLTQPPTGEFDVEQVPTVQRALAQAANAQVRYERGRALYERQPPMLSQQELADLETAAAVARGDADVARLEARGLVASARARASELAAARKRLADTRVLAPGSADAGSTVTYAVAERLLEVGEYVSAGTALYRLVRDQPIRLRAAVPERHLGQLAFGQLARLKVESYDRTFEGHVSRLSPAIDPQSRTFEVEVVLPNTDLQLRPGAFATAEILSGSSRAVALVPRTAVVSFAGIDRIYSPAGEKAAEHVVKVGPPRGQRVAILDGLGTATQVIVSGAAQLTEGRAITVTTSPAVE